MVQQLIAWGLCGCLKEIYVRNVFKAIVKCHQTLRNHGGFKSFCRWQQSSSQNIPFSKEKWQQEKLILSCVLVCCCCCDLFPPITRSVVSRRPGCQLPRCYSCKGFRSRMSGVPKRKRPQICQESVQICVEVMRQLKEKRNLKWRRSC